MIGLITLQHVQYLAYLTIFINHLKMDNALKNDRGLLYSFKSTNMYTESEKKKKDK